MITKESLIAASEAFMAESDYYLVKVTTTADTIEVLIDTFEGVDIDYCAALNRHLNEQFAPDIDNYDLMVASAGLTEPFLVHQQYEKNLGQPVEVLSADGKKYYGTLTDVTDADFEIEWEAKEKVEGAKRKQLVTHQQRFTYPDIKYCRYDLKV